MSLSKSIAIHRSASGSIVIHRGASNRKSKTKVDGDREV
jgi:hypothetical protein